MDRRNATPTPLYDSFRPYAEEFFGFMLGNKLGEGKYRAVYVCEFNDKLVYKMEIRFEDLMFSNVMEFETWQQVKDTPHAKWFAPCEGISRGGMILAQQRTQPIDPKRIPKKIPHYLSDAHPDNWGLLKGKPVVHDYGFIGGMMRDTIKRKNPRMVDYDIAQFQVS